LVVIPQEIIDRLHWKTGDELEPEAKDGKLIVKKK
jgi:AbrB family looped-hinge helix DNA binding protein